MFSRLPGPIVGVIAYFFHFLTTAFISVLILFPLGFIKLLMPTEALRNIVTRWVEFAVPQLWVKLNTWHGKLTSNLKLELRGDINALSKKEWCLVIGNHQSWVDVLLLGECLIPKMATPKFFFKKETLLIPFVGLTCWILDFPLMRRYSKEYLKEHPEKKGKDIEETRAACAKYQARPVSVINFIEGTRFTQKKQQRQQSPYRYLLKPKAGGVGLVMTCMGDLIKKFVHVTFVYPTGKKTFWDFLSNRMKQVVIQVETHPVTPDLIGNYPEDLRYRAHFQHYLNEVWAKKDGLIDSILLEYKKPK